MEIQFVRNGRTTDVAPKGYPESFHHLSHLNFYELLAVGVARNTFETRMAMKIIGISKKEQEAILRVMTFVLHLVARDTHSCLAKLAIMISVLLCSNLEDKVLIEVGSIVMNRLQPNMETNMDDTQIDIGPRRSNWARPSQSLIWDPC
uniref:Myosin-5 n=1 Tax=Nicotiana tabacum TaxID=4097 RepID=A0A1S3XN62_TOBAC|nr:PREDICTED: myosin-5-like [Nicotiana tabacum]